MPKYFLNIKINKNLIKKIVFVLLIFILFLVPSFGVRADKTSDEITDEKEEKEKERDKDQKQLDQSEAEVKQLEVEQDTLEQQLEEETMCLVQVMAEMKVVDEQIADVENEISIVADELNSTIELEKQQYEAMKVRIKYLYEAGNDQLLSVYLNSGSISEALTKAEYIEDLYEYDRQMLNEYSETIAAVSELKATLEEKKIELVNLKEDYKQQSAEKQEIIDNLRSQSDEYTTKIAAAERQATYYAEKIKEQNKEIKRLEQEAKAAKEEEKRLAAEKAAEEAKAKEKQLKEQQEEAQKASEEVARAQEENEKAEAEKKQEEAVSDVDEAKSTGVVTTTNNGKYDVSSIYAANGSDLGKSIAVYGCQYIGNPYVRGGNSLTNGTDCSGFTMLIYQNFGYSLPRTSYDQRFIGTEVSYSQAQPGDIICYAGHVAIYIGNGKIVHASTPSGGIKVGSATYTNIITVRRIVQ